MTASANTSSTRKTHRNNVVVLSTPALQHFGDGSSNAAFSADRTTIINQLNQTLATEMTSVFRYRRHHFIARGIQALDIADEFMLHAEEKLEHAHKIADCIMQLGGKAVFNQESLSAYCSAKYLGGHSAVEMITANLAIVKMTIAHYLDMIQRIDAKDAITGKILKAILAEEEVEAGALTHFLAALLTKK